MNIKAKLLTAFLVTTLLPILIVAAFTIQTITKQARQDFIDTSTQDVALVDNTFVTFFDSVGHLLSAITEFPAVRDTESGNISTYFNEPHKPAEVAMSKEGREKKIFELFSSLGNSNPDLGYVYIGDTTGGYVE